MEFPGGPVISTWHFHRWGCGFDPWLGILQASWHGQKRKKKKKSKPVTKLMDECLYIYYEFCCDFLIYI